MSIDRTQQQGIIDALAASVALDAAHIGVAVSDAVVTLSGHVESEAQRMAAVDLVQRMPDVRGLADELEVRHPGDKKLADSEIAERAVRLLDWDLCVPKGTLTVTVANGVVTLRGTVQWQFLRRDAELDISKLGGVKGVINEIEVQVQDESPISDPAEAAGVGQITRIIVEESALQIQVSTDARP